MHDYFDLIQDKANEPYFLASEKDDFINRAQEKFVNNIVFRDILGKADVPKGTQAIYGNENDLMSNEILKTLITVDKGVDTDAGGSKLEYTSIGSKLMHILGIRTSGSNSGDITKGKTLRFIRHNDQGRFEENTFKKGTTSKPYYKIGDDGVYLYPITGTVENLLITFLNKPTDVALNGSACELPDYTHEKVLKIALSEAGIPTESQMLVMGDKI
jgi:hypothetical protein